VEPGYSALRWSSSSASSPSPRSSGVSDTTTVRAAARSHFLFINLYTRFFEYCWDSLHKAIFFAVAGRELWLLGRRAEAIWNLGPRHGCGRIPQC